MLLKRESDFRLQKIMQEINYIYTIDFNNNYRA